MRQIPPLAAVRVFEAAARLGNFTRAAEELGMTQAAVSYQVKLLEERLGMALFHRVRRQVVLTEAGQRIAPSISSAFDTMHDAFARARTQSESVLTISCSQTFASNWLAARLGVFQVQRPALAVRLHTDDRIVDFAEEEIDVAIRNGPGRWPGLVAHFLIRVPIVPVASPAFLARHPPVRTPADVLRLPRLSPDDVWWTTWAKAMAVAPAAEATSGVRLDSQVMDGRAAMAGQGFAVLNAALWRTELRSGALVQPVAGVAYGKRHYWLVYPEALRHSAKVRAFRDWLLAEVRAEFADDPDAVLQAPAESSLPA